MKPGETARLDHNAIPVTKEIFMEEATLKTAVSPISARVLARMIDRPASDWVIHFRQAPPNLETDYLRKVAASQYSIVNPESPIAIAAGATIQQRFAPEQRDVPDAVHWNTNLAHANKKSPAALTVMGRTELMTQAAWRAQIVRMERSYHEPTTN
ncbi:hypothetical protein K3495_g5383 [Podosphaera aphanis]|nr:hypothetical protein K3495_g5383 [Podosphaera aphanis]